MTRHSSRVGRGPPSWGTAAVRMTSAWQAAASVPVAKNGGDAAEFKEAKGGAARHSRQSFTALRAQQGLRNGCDNSFDENYFHGFKGH